jgi:hypothetical protein
MSGRRVVGALRRVRFAGGVVGVRPTGKRVLVGHEA